MRIIDLVEKQRHNEILPKHIKYENENLYFDGVSYFDKEGNNDLLDILAMNSSALTHLYDEVEIIEEDKEEFEDIEEIKMIGCKVEINILDKKSMFGTDTPIVTEHCISKINQLIKNQKKLIDEVNKLKNREK